MITLYGSLHSRANRCAWMLKELGVVFKSVPTNFQNHVADAMTVVDMGPFGGRRELAGRDELRRGVGALLTTPAFSPIDYTRGYHAQLLASDLRSRGVLRVGLVGQGAMPHGFVTTLREQLAGVAFEDATDAVDEIKAIKSSEEAEWIVLSPGCRTKPSLPSQGAFVQGCATMKSRRSRGERRRTREANRASRRESTSPQPDPPGSKAFAALTPGTYLDRLAVCASRSSPRSRVQRTRRALRPRRRRSQPPPAPGE